MTTLRLKYIDILRSLAIVLMIFTHTVRLFPLAQRDGFMKFMMLIEPVTPALFLFLSGFSLSLSYTIATISTGDVSAWKKKHVKKSIGLIAIGMAMFFVEYGFQLPDLLLSPNILSAIGFSLIFSILLIEYNIKTFYLVTSLVLILSLGLSLLNLSISGLTGGNGALIPLCAFAFLGVVFERTRNFSKFLLPLGFLTALSLISSHNWIDLFASSYDPSMSFLNPIKAGPTVFWNHNVKGVVICLFVINVLLLVLSKLRFNSKIVEFLSARSLSIYIIHLMVLGLARQLSLPNFYLTYFFVVILSVLLVLAKDKTQSFLFRSSQ